MSKPPPPPAQPHGPQFGLRFPALAAAAHTAASGNEAEKRKKRQAQEATRRPADACLLKRLSDTTTD